MPEIRIRGTYTRSCNIGLLDFTFDDGTRLSYTLHSTIGAPVWEPLVLTPADLRNGVSTWRTKIAASELVRLERYRAGGSYYDPEGDG
jgi:alkaline phosphatase D